VSDRQLTDGSPVPEDGSHTQLRPDGQQKGYVVLTPEERAKGFVKPVRRTYLHKCGTTTTMSVALAETYARDPHFYSGTFCCGCSQHFPLNEFTWEPDGEPMDPGLQSGDWQKQKARREADERLLRAAQRVDRLEKERHEAWREYEAAQIAIANLETPPEGKS
jgi:hypothetical protein